MNENNKIVIFSPHFDDAMFSCAGTIADFIKQGREVIVCTVFSGKSLSNNLSEFAKKICSSNSVEMREEENDRIVHLMGAKSVNLGYLDAIFRLDSNGICIHDSWKKIFNSCISDNNERKLLQDILVKISNVVRTEKADFYFPLSIGNHIDHCLVNTVAKMLIERFKLNNIIFYEDLPYANKGDICGNLESAYEVVNCNVIDIEYKIKAISGYHYGLSIGDGSDKILSEIEQYALKLNPELGCCERFWRFKQSGV